jgi:hypothetical protein
VTNVVVVRKHEPDDDALRQLLRVLLPENATRPVSSSGRAAEEVRRDGLDIAANPRRA